MEVDVIDGGGGEDRVKVRVVGDKDEAAGGDLSIGERWIFVTILRLHIIRKRKDDFKNSMETIK